MASKVTIEKAKNIKRLEFTIPSNPGVYLLVGPNGSGKTTLLTCLDRIGNSKAFAENFISSQLNNEVDQYKSAVITYKRDVPVVNVSFRKGDKRWNPTPKNGTATLASFGYAATAFIKADAKRITVPSEDIRKGNVTAASSTVKEGMNELFETNRYSKLKRLKNTYGRGRKVQYYYVFKEGDQYYSEKRFSTGELALLRLIERLAGIPDNSMILLDEAEMALHPRVQKNLLDYLTRIASDKKLTVIIATHSQTMIKSVDKNHIFMLKESVKGRFNVINPCYPAQALGSVDYIENTDFDAIFFVEDEMARLILKKLIQRCIVDGSFSTINFCVVPVGGYNETAKLALNTKDKLFNRSKVFAVWDEDVFTETIPSNQEVQKLHADNQDVIFRLGCTPELWMIKALESENEDIIRAIRDTFRIEVRNILRSNDYTKCNNSNPRKLAKAKMDVLIDMIMETSGDGIEMVLNNLADIVIDSEYDIGKIKSIVMPMLSRVR